MTSFESPYDDATTHPFWEGAAQRELRLQRCRSCGKHQFYPRPFCLACDSEDLEWSRASGLGRVYSVTTVRIPVLEELEPPYQVALVSLAEGPRFLAGIVGEACEIDDVVELEWRDRDELPSLPVFQRRESSRG